MKSPRSIPPPSNEKNLPEFLKLKSSRSDKHHGFLRSESDKHFTNRILNNNKKYINPHSRVNSPKAEFPPISIENLSFQFSDEFKKFNTFFTENSLSKTLLEEHGFEEINHRAPAGRKDAKMLIEWLDFMLQKVVNEKIESPDSLFEVANEIYSACIYEITRQVGAHCKERGYLLSRVWKAYQTLFEKTLSISKFKYNLLQEKNTNEKNNLHIHFRERITQLEQKIQNLLTENAEMHAKLQEQSEVISDKSEKEARMLNSLCIIQAQYKIVKKELLVLREDSRILKVKYKNIGAENEYNHMVIPKRFKRKTSDDLDRELEKSPLFRENLIEDSEILEKLTKFGKNYADRDLDTLFTQDDYRDRGTGMSPLRVCDSQLQTSVEDLCGDSIGVKKRRTRLNPPNLLARATRPVFFPDYRPYNPRTLTIEAENLNSNPQNPELKKKHLRVRRLLSTIKDVISQ